jgi:hypothetical protein
MVNKGEQKVLNTRPEVGKRMKMPLGQEERKEDSDQDSSRIARN